MIPPSSFPGPSSPARPASARPLGASPDAPELPRRPGPPAAVLALAGLLTLACRTPAEAPATAPASGPLHLVVLHTNDVHGQVLPRETSRSGPHGSGGLPRAAARAAEIRRAESGPGTGVLFVDAGDWFQGTPEGMLDGGLGFLRAMAAADYEAAAIGNHEFDLGLPHLVELLSRTGPDLRPIAANLRDPATGERVSWVDPWRIVRRLGLDIALVGLVTTDTPRITHPDAAGLDFADPVAELGRVLAELDARGGVDLVIPVGHVGLDDGERLARAFPELPLVVTGHTHTYLREGRRFGDTLVVQAGDKATVLGRVDLTFDPVTLELLGSTASLLQLEEPLVLAPDAPASARRTAAVCEELAARADLSMGVTVGRLTVPLTRGLGPGSTVAGNWISDVMRARTGADVAFHNRGGTRRELSAGTVTRRDVFELLPFDNHLVTLELDGATLAAVVARSVGGTGGAGRLDFSGLAVELRAQAGGGPRPVRVFVGGAPLDRAARYSVTTNSFVARGGDGYVELEGAAVVREDPILLRELVIEALGSESGPVPSAEQRLVTLP